jgi:integrase/recombinase XerD
MQWLEYLKRERGRSAKTCENYERYLDRFLVFVKVDELSDLTEKLISNYREHLSGRVGNKGLMLSVRTQNCYLSALRQFLAYLQRIGVDGLSPQVVKREREKIEPREQISEEALRQLLAAPDMKRIEGQRDRAILLMLASTGVRTSEICALDVNDLDMATGELLVDSGTKHDRAVFLSDEALVAVVAYLDSRTDAHPALFLRIGRKANDGGDLRLIPRQLQRLIKQHAAAAGIAEKVTPQLIRNAYAATLLHMGADIDTARTLLGHEHIVSTKACSRHR